jgi:hypothetical protein
VEAVAGAIVAMLFACFVLLIMAALVYSAFVHSPGIRIHGETIVIGILSLIEAFVLVLVIAQTWRRTTLQARNGTLCLRQINLFGDKVFRWPFHLIDHLSVVPTQTTVDAHLRGLAELQFRVAGATPVHLFTDHLEREVREIYDALTRVMTAP